MEVALSESPLRARGGARRKLTGREETLPLAGACSNPPDGRAPWTLRLLPGEVARETLRRLELHFAPKHANWLDMVEIEIGVLVKQCPDRRIADPDTLRRELASRQRRRNAEGARVKLLFGVRRAREKLDRTYPTPLSNELHHTAWNPQSSCAGVAVC